MKNKKIPQHLIVFFILISLIPFLIAVSSIYHGRIAFWFDPARDLLLGLKNLEHPTLIGQPTGIPGILYPPYWIWFISLILVFSKNPQVVSFFLLTLPYFIIFPFFLYKLVKRWGNLVFGALWFLFITNFIGYSTQIWNIHPFPLFMIITIYFSISAYEIVNNQKKKLLFFFLSGVFLGAASTFHLSLGIPIVISFISFHLLLFIIGIRKSIRKLNKSLLSFPLFLLGIFLAYVPTLFFELRHDFLQTKTFMKAFTESVFYNSAVVGQKGLMDDEILLHLFGRAEILLSLSLAIITIFTAFIFVELLFRHSKKKLKIETFEKRIILLCILISLWTLIIFLSNSNPVWNYYFLGLEIIFLLLFGLFAKKTVIGKSLLLLAVLLTLLFSFKGLSNNLKANDYTVTDLATRSYIVNLILENANKDYYYFAYNPAIYTYEYDYLFKLNDEGRLSENSDLIYLIIPKTTDGIREDFINYRAPGDKFNKVSEWRIPEGTIIYKMQRK